MVSFWRSELLKEMDQTEASWFHISHILQSLLAEKSIKFCLQPAEHASATPTTKTEIYYHS